MLSKKSYFGLNSEHFIDNNFRLQKWKTKSSRNWLTLRSVDLSSMKAIVLLVITLVSGKCSKKRE